MKKTLSILLAIVMLFALCVTAYAENDDGSITIDNAVTGEKYNAYKIFDLTYDDDNVTYTYTTTGGSDAFLTALSDTASPFNAVKVGTTDVYSITKKTGVTDESVISWLKSNISKVSASNKLAEKTGANNEAKWENVEYGYYYVTSSLGSAVTVNSAKKDVTIQDKNSPVSVTKKQSTTNGSNYTTDEVSASIGDEIFYEVTIVDGEGTNLEVTFTDTMTDGLTNLKNYVLYKNSVDNANKLALTTNYTVESEDDHGFTLKINAATLTSLNKDEKIIARYSARVNSNAVTKGSGNNTNTATITYSHQTTTTSVNVTTYKIQIVKDNANGKGVLNGATFRLYDALTGGNEIKTVKDSAGKYHVDTQAATGALIEAGTPVITGLKAGTYYLEEVDSPKGFNKLTERKPVTVSADNIARVNSSVYVNGGVEVQNSAGSSLPTTGGTGTTLLIILGSFAVLTTGVFLVANKRMKKEML